MSRLAIPRAVLASRLGWLCNDGLLAKVQHVDTHRSPRTG